MDQSERVDLVARRVDLLEKLTDGPLHKPAIVEATGQSRSTVDRAIRELEDAGYVTRVTDGYVTTNAGSLAARRYRSFVAEQTAIADAAGVLADLPRERDPPLDLVTGATVEPADATDPFDLVSEEFLAADGLRVVLPALWDSRFVRLCHDRVVAEGCEGELLAPGETLETVRDEFPTLATELRETDRFATARVDDPAVALVLATNGSGDAEARSDADAADAETVPGLGDPVAALLVALRDGQPTATLRTTEEAPVDWVTDYYRSLRETSEQAGDAFRADGDARSLADVATDRLPAGLRAEGFVELDESYLADREPLAPATSWRSGLGLPEVAAGYAVDRRRDDGGTVTEHLLESLGDGRDVVLHGPPGAGKSTVCKRVACDWQADGGRVLYRESNSGRPFDDDVALERTIERSSGPVLVVVEDAVREEANAVFETMYRFGADDGVVFLLDARDEEWHDSRALADDARLESFRQERVTTVPMPTLDERERDRLLDAAERTLDESLDVPVAEFGPTGDRGTGAGAPGGVHLLFHRLAQYVDPPTSDERRPPTSLDEDVERVLGDLSDIGPVAERVGVLVNALNVAGLPVTPAYAFAAGIGESDDRREVRAALDRLEGHVLVGGRNGRYGVVHESWSARYLERVLQRGETTAAELFGGTVSALLALADDESRRATVRSAVDGPTEVLDRVDADPDAWADETVASLFETGRTYPKLAPLFGTTDTGVVDLPDACATDTAVACSLWRARGYLRAGRLDRARREFRALPEDREAVPGHGIDALQLRRRTGLADVARQRGDLSTAADHVSAALALAEDADAPLEVVRTRITVADVEKKRGDPAAATAQLEDALAASDDLGAPLLAGRALLELGHVASMRSDFAAAADYYRRCRDRAAAVDDSQLRMKAVGSLGQVALWQDDVETARGNCRLALGTARETGNRDMEATALEVLGDAEYLSGALGEAEDYYEQTLEIARRSGDDHTVATALGSLGNVAQARGDLDDARAYFAEETTHIEAVGDHESHSAALVSLAEVDLARGNPASAGDDAERALELAEEVGSTRLAAKACAVCGRAAMHRGEYDAAEGWLGTALDDYESGVDRSDRDGAGATLSRVAARTGSFDTATEYVDEYVESEPRRPLEFALVALERGDHAAASDALAGNVDAPETHRFSHVRADLLAARAAVARHEGDLDRARDLADRAISTATEAGGRVLELGPRLERGAVAVDLGQYERAAAELTTVVETAREVGDLYFEARASFQLGRLATARGDDEGATGHLSDSVDLFLELGAADRAARAVERLAHVRPEHEATEATRERIRRYRESDFDRDLDLPGTEFAGSSRWT